MQMVRPIIAIIIFFTGIGWSIYDFIHYSGILASLAACIGTASLALWIFPGREFLPMAVKLSASLAFLCACASWMLHAPALDIDKSRSQENIVIATIGNMATNSIPEDLWKKLVISCASQSEIDQISSIIQAKEIEDPELISFIKRASGNNYQAPIDQCTDETNKVNNKYPEFFIEERKDIEILNRKKSKFSW